jgi:phosphotransferase system HPr-like phosphotransfer protein
MVEPQSLNEIISEDEFLALLEVPCAQIINLYYLFKDRSEKKVDVSRKFYSNLIQESEYLESFMDEYGARENKKWNYFVECLASIRNLSIAAFFTRHLLDRYPYYKLKESPETGLTFNKDASGVIDFLNDSIMSLFNDLHLTSIDNGLSVSRVSKEQIEFNDIEVNKRLPRNVADDEVNDEEGRIIEVCEKIKYISKLMNESKLIKMDNIDEIKLAVLRKFNEKRARKYKNLIHNVQSDFDTYVKNTKFETDYKELKILRGYISMPLHLLEISLWMAHFYERHEDEIRPGENRRKISLLVNKDILLGKIINFGFFYSHYFIKEGKNLAEDILKCFTKVVRVELPIPHPLGFHARPSTYVSIIGRQYDDMDLFIILDGEKINTKSVMSLLQVGGTVADKGYQTIVFEGDKRVIEDIKLLAKHNYCEDSKIPSRLAYLQEFKKS